MGGGWIGNFIFFAISVWFLLDRDLSLKLVFKRVWLLERELLFWSLGFCVVSIILSVYGITDISIGLMLRSVVPLLTSLWWYPTSYALFLLFLPFLVVGFQALGERKHRKLAFLVLIIWGLLGLIPSIQLDLTSRSVFVMFYWFILLAYCKWYCPRFSAKRCWGFIGVGVIIEMLYWTIGNIIYTFTGKEIALQSFIFDHWKLPSMMIGMGLFQMCLKSKWKNRAVNWIAASTFGVYLIHYHPAVFSWWSHLFPLKSVYYMPYPIVSGLAVVISIFVVCLVTDAFRHVLFSITIDRNPGRWFELMWNRIMLSAAYRGHVESMI